MFLLINMIATVAYIYKMSFISSQEQQTILNPVQFPYNY